MPANIAHMLIAYKALNRIQAQDIKPFNDLIDQFLDPTYRAFVNLGSISPDLFYYNSLIGNAASILADGAVKARGVEPWAYHMHSVRPNEYPLHLVEIVFKDMGQTNPAGAAAPKKFKPDIARLAFIAGHLSHMAADHVIHPLVNSIAGPYYSSGQCREDHRTCEVYQDIFLYNDVYRYEGKTGDKYNFFKQSFNEWADIKTDAWFQNTEDWFRFFIQRGFAETYGQFMDEKLIEECVDNLLSVLRLMTSFGPYKKAEKEYLAYVTNGTGGPNYKKYIEDPRYLWAYRQAVELSAIYILALYEAYAQLMAGGDFTEAHKKRFLSIVSGADLSCPLEKNILQKAIDAYTKAPVALKGIGTKAVPAINQFQPINEKVIQSAKTPEAVVTLKIKEA